MRRRTPLARILVLSGLVLVAPLQAARKPYAEGGSLPFHLPDLGGVMVHSGDPRFRGRVLLVDLWGTFCPPCLTEIPTFVDLQERYGDDGLVIIGIAFEREPDTEVRRQQLREFVAAQGINYLILDGGTFQRLNKSLPTLRGFKGFPTEILIDRDGKVVEARSSFGYSKRWATKLERELTDLLGMEPEDE